ncbi:MAG: class I SAM-dependent methyltransferase [candidate division Zixibacteria bacterium]|nr:class I SAM-dependent methyltransferase [candidate division Zixibacteria bacterium]
MTRIYSYPEIYDIAFQDRPLSGEVDFLLTAAQKFLNRSVTSALELACGPGYHLRELAARNVISDGLDIEPAMVAYTQTLVKKQKLNSHIIEADMRLFSTQRRYDLCFCLLCSFAHLLSNEDIVSHFHAVADCLVDGGIYIISTAHPRDFYNEESAPESVQENKTWLRSRGDLIVETDWGGNDQQYDPLTEIDEITITFTVTNTANGAVDRIVSTDHLRRCSLQTFRALVELSGQFEIVAVYGDFDVSVRLDNSDDSVRFIPVLRKITLP